MEISWADRVKSKEELQRVREERQTLHTINRKKDNSIDHISLRYRLLKYNTEEKTEGKIKGTERRERRRKQLLDNLGGSIRYWKQQEEAADRTVWRTQQEKDFEPVVRQSGGGGNDDGDDDDEDGIQKLVFIIEAHYVLCDRQP